MFDKLSNCNICPRDCNENRLISNKGICKSGAGYSIASIFMHQGEEPVISGRNGICNIFFTSCNLKCIYCQNEQISHYKNGFDEFEITLEELLRKVTYHLDAGCKLVGFVSPSHFIPQMVEIINAIKTTHPDTKFVYNTNAYDKPETIAILEDIIDIYLPDFKYMDSELARRFSGAPDYPEVAAKSIKEMFRQKGSNLFLNEDGTAESGLIIRHLVLPGHVQNSIDVLKYIGEEFSTSIHISLMSQYNPTAKVKDHPELGRRLSEEEYNRVIEAMDKLGFYRGWQQELESSIYYNPDFSREKPF